MEKEGLPQYSAIDTLQRSKHRVRRSRVVKLVGLGCLVFLAYAQWTQIKTEPSLLSIERLQADLDSCSVLQHKPKDPSGTRDKNARFIDGKPTLIRNATIWTGEPVRGTTAEEARAGIGYGWIKSDVLIENGLIISLKPEIKSLPKDCEIWDAEGRQLTAGVIDMHSHTGVYPLPTLKGGSDGNEASSDITPYVRSIDGLDPMDAQLQSIKSGGVTTSLILPGSANNMGGEAYIIKHAVGPKDGRAEVGIKDLLADPEQNWRFMKMACGENPKNVYGHAGYENGPSSRMGESWFFRHAFEEATSLVNAQDDWCSAAATVGAKNMKTYLPKELKWESLGAALRGQVHINTHCYTIADLEAFVDHTNEFKFPVRAFHHAHQTYLVPEILKRAWGGRAPAAAIFADNMYYKVEAYTASEQAGKFLYESEITPVFVSDNPVLNAQHLVVEAAKGYRYGLPYHAAIASVTSAPAELLGMGERIGKIKSGFDADIVVWDSDPLSIGATPVQVWIDGTAQFPDAIVLNKTVSEPIVPNEDLSAIIPEEPSDFSDIIFTGVFKIMIPGSEQVLAHGESVNVVVEGGKIVCTGVCKSHVETASSTGIKFIEMKNGYLSPSFVAFGSKLGLVEIEQEAATQNGDDTPESFSRAVDGLQLNTKSLQATYAHGVTRAISAPADTKGGNQGISVGFLTGALQPLEEGAVWAEEISLHYTLTLGAKQGKTPSISSAVGELRHKLLKAISANETEDKYSEAAYLKKAVTGDIPLVVSVHSADTIAAIIRVKSEVEAAISAASIQNVNSNLIRLVIYGGGEAHLVAKEIASAKISVVVAPIFSYAEFWDMRRSLSGAPVTNGTTIDVLIEAGVTTAIGTAEDWEIRDLSFLAGTVFHNSGGKITEADALSLIGKNYESILGVKIKQEDFVVFEGSPFETGSRIRAVGSLNKVSVW